MAVTANPMRPGRSGGEDVIGEVVVMPGCRGPAGEEGFGDEEDRALGLGRGRGEELAIADRVADPDLARGRPVVELEAEREAWRGQPGDGGEVAEILDEA